MKQIEDSFYYQKRKDEYEYLDYPQRDHDSYYTEIYPRYEKKDLDYDIFGNRDLSYGRKPLKERPEPSPYVPPSMAARVAADDEYASVLGQALAANAPVPGAALATMKAALISAFGSARAIATQPDLVVVLGANFVRHYASAPSVGAGHYLVARHLAEPYDFLADKLEGSMYRLVVLLNPSLERSSVRWVGPEGSLTIVPLPCEYEL